MQLIAKKRVAYGGHRYKPGDQFEALRKHARLLIKTRQAAPVQPAKGTYERRDLQARPPAQNPQPNLLGDTTPATDELGPLRAEYEATLGKRPYYGWDAATLREKIAAAKTEGSGDFAPASED